MKVKLKWHVSEQRRCIVCSKPLVKDQKKCCSRSCSATYGNRKATGDKARNWKGGRNINSEGYVRIYMPEHPYACAFGMVYEHRVVVEKYLGKFLLPEEVVHHINGDKQDNKIQNLQLLPNQREHKKLHERNRRGVA